MATGSGKTRTVIALVDQLMKVNWVKRVLFLADRTALVNQAAGAFKTHLPGVTTVNLVTEKATDGRVYVSTSPMMMNLIDDLDAGLRRFGPGYFDVYRLDQAVGDGFLVPPFGVSVGTKFLRQGITYNDLTEEEEKGCRRPCATRTSKRSGSTCWCCDASSPSSTARHRRGADSPDGTGDRRSTAAKEDHPVRRRAARLAGRGRRRRVVGGRHLADARGHAAPAPRAGAFRREDQAESRVH